MAKESKLNDFPDIKNKLGAPTKKSLFERQKAEAEAKRQREQEETAAVYEDFVKSFDDDVSGAPSSDANSGAGPPGGAFPKRHFSGPPRGGLGSRGGSGPGSLGPPPPYLSRKRPYDSSDPTRREGLFAFEDDTTGPVDPKIALQQLDEETTNDQRISEDRAVPKPTIRLSSLPPGTSPAAIKAIIPPTLTVEGVRILPPSGPGTNNTERRSMTAILTLAQDTPALDIDTVVNALQNRYMGRGYYLSLSRHLSSTSAGISAASTSLGPSGTSLPFGARPAVPLGLGLGRAAPSSVHRGGFAPPTSFNAPQNQFARGGASQLQVTVTPPSDLKQLKIIHKTLEALVRNGPEFEALLMSRREVQQDEKWAWLWDSRSVGGVYYRWRLWEICSGLYRKKGRAATSTQYSIFENGAAWVAPEQKLPYEYTTHLDEFVSDSDYHSSDEEDSGDEGRRRYAQHHGGAPPPDGPAVEVETQAYLNPFQKAKLTYLLARLPTTNAKLRRGDVARVTAFAIQHAGEGAEEVVSMIVTNVAKPFAFTSANPDREPAMNGTNQVERTNETNDDTPKPEEKSQEDDMSAAKLVALYVISDLLSSSSTSGVRHAWRYRSLFETALKRHHSFEHLGRLEKTLKWGRLRAEKWKRSLNNVLALWAGWCVFPNESQEEFSSVFNDPPLTKEEEAEKEAEEEERKSREAKKRWKTLDEKREAQQAEAEAALDGDVNAMDVDEDEDESDPGDSLDDNQGDFGGRILKAMAHDHAKKLVDLRKDMAKGVSLMEGANDAEEDGVAILLNDRRAQLAASLSRSAPRAPSDQLSPLKQEAQAGKAPPRKRQRPKAEDMFADDED